MIEANGIIKHDAHIIYSACIPAREASIKRVSFVEHAIHIPKQACIPHGYVAVEYVCSCEHVAHIGCLSGIPLGNVPVERGAFKHETKMRTSTGVPHG